VPLSGVGIVALDSILFRDRLQRDLSAMASIIADTSTAALSFEDPRSANETLAALRARPRMVTACIYRASGTILARYSRPGASSGCPAPGAPNEMRFSSKILP
jgi:hypothetical protein